jgi:hypothetical protein
VEFSLKPSVDEATVRRVVMGNISRHFPDLKGLPEDEVFTHIEAQQAEVQRRIDQGISPKEARELVRSQGKMMTREQRSKLLSIAREKIATPGSI